MTFKAKCRHVIFLGDYFGGLLVLKSIIPSSGDSLNFLLTIQFSRDWAHLASWCDLRYRSKTTDISHHIPKFKGGHMTWSSPVRMKFTTCLMHSNLTKRSLFYWIWTSKMIETGADSSHCWPWKKPFWKQPPPRGSTDKALLHQGT